MRIAYLTTTYPSVSHTFIRRELTELERQVGPVARLAVRDSPYVIVDDDDAREDGQTWRLLRQSPLRWAQAFVQRGVVSPMGVVRGLKKAMDLGFRSQRGLPHHLLYFAEALLLLDELRRRRIDHLHVHFGTNPTTVAAIARAMGGPPYSFTVHGPDELDAPVALKLGTKIADAAFVVAITDYCAGQLRRWAPRDDWHKIRVVHCTVGKTFFEARRPIDPDSRVLVCVGRLSAQKGQLFLVEAFADAIDRGLDASLVLAGDGDTRAEIEALAAARGIADRLTITGWISGAAVREAILDSRALVLPSFAEGLPMVIMEAFALGRPVLSTYVAGIPELVRDGDNGWLVPSGSKAAITDAIMQIMETPVSRLEAMAEHGRALVVERHDTAVETAKLRTAMEAGAAGTSRPDPGAEPLGPTLDAPERPTGHVNGRDFSRQDLRS